MPIYEYRCPGCGHEFEEMRRMSESGGGACCPECGQTAERLVSGVASQVGYYLRAPSKPPFRQTGQT